MRATPAKAGRQPRSGSRFLSGVVAGNVRAARALRGLSQGDLAERMSVIGHEWSRATVSDVERARRNLTVDELLALAAVLGRSIGELLDPDGGESIDFSAGHEPMPAAQARAWLRDSARVTMQWDESGPGGLRYEPLGDRPNYSDSAVAGLVAMAAGRKRR